MAQESQGVKFRRISTAAGTTATLTSTGISINSTANTIQRDAGSFIVDGWTTGMRIVLNSTNNTGIKTAYAVAATAITIIEPVTDQAMGVSKTMTGNVYVSVGNIRGWNGPTGAAAVIDVSNLDSTAKEKMMGLKDEGQVTLDILAEGTNEYQIALKADRGTRTKRTYEITFTDQSTLADAQPSGMQFDAYVTGYADTGQVDGAVTGSITLEVTSTIHNITKK